MQVTKPKSDKYTITSPRSLCAHNSSCHNGSQRKQCVWLSSNFGRHHITEFNSQRKPCMNALEHRWACSILVLSTGISMTGYDPSGKGQSRYKILRLHRIAEPGPDDEQCPAVWLPPERLVSERRSQTTKSSVDRNKITKACELSRSLYSAEQVS